MFAESSPLHHVALALPLDLFLFFFLARQFPPVGQPKDPRTQKTVLGVTGSQIDLKMPRFKVSAILAKL